MLKSFYLHRYPFVRLAIPWIAGVFCGDCFFDKASDMSWGILLLCLFAGLSMGCYLIKCHSFRWCFGVALFCSCFMGGWCGITWQLKQAVYDFPKEESIYRVVVSEQPELKERSVLCRVTVKEWRDSLAVYPVDRQAILYLGRDSLAAQLKGGEELLISGSISLPVNNGNFDEFDYTRYLLRKGIGGTGYIASGKWKQLDVEPFYSFRSKATFYREKVLSLYRKLGFDGDELAVLSALTVGEKTELSDSILESYSVSGASHVLALSGLHIGLLYALFFFLLKPLTERWRMGRYLRSFLLISLLWTFAYFTGLSSSVVRSAGMFSMLALADLSGRQSFSMNTLAATAFLMLLCNPVWLFDVGFQLSFLAVAAILLIQQPIYRLISVRNRISKYIWGLMSVSIAAQLGTAPLVLFYFSRFSTHFLLTNLIVIPLVTVILYAAVLMLFLSSLAGGQGGLTGIVHSLASSVNYLLKGLNGFIRWVEQLPYASFDSVWLYQLEIVGIYLFLFFICFYLIVRRAKYLLLSLTCLLVLCTSHAVMMWYNRPQCSLVFYNVRGCPAVHCIEDDGRSWLVYGEHSADKARLKRVSTNFWRHHPLKDSVELISEHENSRISFHQGILMFHNCRVCMVTDSRWQNKRANSPLSIQYLYLCKGYTGEVEELTALFHPSCILLDASLPEYKKRSFQDECKRLDIRVVSLSEKGSVQFLL